MMPINRNVSLFMDENMYEKLGNVPDIDNAWSLIRCLVGEEIFQKDYVSVPHLETAVFYNQLFVFKKESDICSKLKLRPPTYKIIGNLDNLLNLEVSTWIPTYDFSPRDILDDSRMYREFNLLITSDNEILNKSIEVCVRQPYARSASPPTPRSVSICMTTLKGTRAIYVITGVVLARYVKVCVNIGTEQSVFIQNKEIPVGYRYQKYKLRANGCFTRELATTLKFSDKEAIWLHPSEQLTPRIPLWDPMGRRNDGSRRPRNILTMPSPPLYRNASPGRNLIPNSGVLRPRIPAILDANNPANIVAVNNNALAFVDNDDQFRIIEALTSYAHLIRISNYNIRQAIRNLENALVDEVMPDRSWSLP